MYARLNGARIHGDWSERQEMVTVAWDKYYALDRCLEHLTQCKSIMAWVGTLLNTSGHLCAEIGVLHMHRQYCLLLLGSHFVYMLFHRWFLVFFCAFLFSFFLALFFLSGVDMWWLLVLHNILVEGVHCVWSSSVFTCCCRLVCFSCTRGFVVWSVDRKYCENQRLQLVYGVVRIFTCHATPFCSIVIVWGCLGVLPAQADFWEPVLTKLASP